jgi:drug/metabolite transporter (DMT)-like permease
MKNSVEQTPSGPTVSIVVAGVIFGSAFLCTKVLVEEMSLVDFVAARMLLAAAAVTGFLIVSGRRPPITRSLLMSAALLALADALIPYVLVSWGQTRINAGTAAVLVSTMPLFTAILSQIVSRDEDLSIARLSGLVIGLAGVAVIAGGGGSAALSTPSAGSGAVVLAAMLYAVAAVYGRRVLATVDATTLNAAKLSIGAAMILPIALSADGASSTGQLDLRGVIALLWIGVVSTGLARVAYFRAVAVAGSVRASMVTYIVPVSGVALGCIVLHEPLPPRSIAGMALIVSGVAVVMYAPALRRILARNGGAARHLLGSHVPAIGEGR